MDNQIQKSSRSEIIRIVAVYSLFGALWIYLSDSKETARQILAIDPKACLIVSSGYSNDPIMAEYRAYGFSGAVAKPYGISELGQLLSSLLTV